MPSNPEREYTPKESAELLGVTPERVRQRFHDGELDGRVQGGSIYVNAATVDAERAAKLAKLSPGLGDQSAQIQLLEKRVADLTQDKRKLHETIVLLEGALRVWTAAVEE
jgi:hypothetical protein